MHPLRDESEDSKKTQDGSIIEIGNCRLVIYARSWLIQKDKKTIVNSDSVSQENIGDLVENKFLKQNLLKIDFANEKLAIATFTSNLNVVLSVTMQKKDEDNLFHLTFPDESLFASNRKLGFYKSS
jgi:hypothetical protein